MELLSCCRVKKSFADQKVLKKVDISIKIRDRIGLVGKNGAGKTTLANVILGKLKPDEGRVIKYRDRIKVGYLEQTSTYTTNNLTDVYSQEEKLSKFLETSSYLKLNGVQDWKKERFNNLSGGEKTKLALAKIWATRPDILILDEPTNHVDFQGRDWLIKELEGYRGAVLIISHDRYFLDETVNRIIELEGGSNNNYNGNYSYYRREKRREYEIQLKKYREQKKQQRKIEAQISQLKQWSAKGHQNARSKAIENGVKFGGKEHYRKKAKKLDKQVKSKLKRLEKMKEERIENPREKPEINFSFDEPDKRGRRLIEARGISKSYGDKILFQDSSFVIQ